MHPGHKKPGLHLNNNRTGTYSVTSYTVTVCNTYI